MGVGLKVVLCCLVGEVGCDELPVPSEVDLAEPMLAWVNVVIVDAVELQSLVVLSKVIEDFIILELDVRSGVVDPT